MKEEAGKREKFEESKVIKSIDVKTLNELFGEKEINLKLIKKTRTMIENVHLSEDKNNQTSCIKEDSHRYSIDSNMNVFNCNNSNKSSKKKSIKTLSKDIINQLSIS